MHRSQHVAGHPSQARVANQALLLQLLLRSGPVSRADLARASGLTPATASGVVADLIDAGIVSEGGRRATSSVGKPPTLVQVAAESPVIACLDLSDDKTMRGAIVTMTGEILARLSSPRRGKPEAVERVLDLAADVIAATDRRVIAVACGTPGVVDGDGVVREAAHLHWHTEPLAARLAARTGLPAHVVNDANAATLAEYSFGGSTSDNLLLIRVTDGLGAGIVLNGDLFTGQHFAAGEVGHVTVTDPSRTDGRTCECGRRGCLEAEIAAALQTDPATDGAARILHDAGSLVGVTLSPVVSLLNLSEIVLSGTLSVVSGPFRDGMGATIRQRTMPAIADALTIRLSALGDDAVLLGMAGHAMRAELGVIP